jgi:hypothetical protein
MGARFAHAGLTAGASLSVSERYTNNLYLSRTDPIGDLSTTVAPRVDLRFDERAISGGVRYQATGVWYRQRRDQNRWSQQGEADAALTALGRAVRGLDVRLSLQPRELPGLPGGQEPVIRWRPSAPYGTTWGRGTQGTMGGAPASVFALPPLKAPTGARRRGPSASSTVRRNSWLHHASLSLRYHYSSRR